MSKKINTNERRTKTKGYLMMFGVVLTAVALILSISLSSAVPSVQTANIVEPETQFELNVAYAYVGKGPTNASYPAANDALMSPKSLYPSTVEFNVMRLAGTRTASYDAIIEFYSVEVTTDTGILEKNCYFIGTNYDPSFSSSELSTLFAHINDVVSPKDLTTPIRGDFEFNMTENSSILSTPIGSTGVYTTGSSSTGLWRTGKPNVVSITVHRVGCLTISDGSVFICRDPSGMSPIAIAQLSNHEDGFLHNNLVPLERLSQVDLFHPIP